MTENMNVETFAMLVRQSEKVRADFCKDVGITLDEYYVKQNGDFEIEDMVRAFQKGFGMALIPLQSQLTEKDKQIAELEAQLEREQNLNQCLSDHNEQLRELIEKMKCCGNCAKNGHICVAEEMQGELCGKNKDKWELRRVNKWQ